MVTDHQPVLEAIEVEKIYRKEGIDIPVLKGISLSISKGEKVAILGDSGAGKSTLLHILGTLDQPTRGKVLYFGKEPPFESDKALSTYRNQTIGFVFQFHHLLPEFSALENVMMPCLIANRDKKEAKNAALSFLKKVGLEHRLNHRPGELSGGELQRVAIARALVQKPKIIFADEPTGNLDWGNGQKIHHLLNELNQELGTPLVLATHNRTLANDMDRMLKIVDGHLVVEK